MIILITHLLLTIFVLPVLFLLLPLQLSEAFWLNISLCALLAAVGNTLIVAALKTTDLSILGPINAYKSVVSLVLGIFLLGEYPTWPGLFGIGLIIAGSYFVLDSGASSAPGNSFARFFQNRGVLLRFLALIFSATEAVFLKKALLVSSPLITFIFWCILAVPVAYVSSVFTVKKPLRYAIESARDKKAGFLSLACTTGLMQFSTLVTFNVMQVGYSLALFQISTLLSVFFGYQFFREKNFARRLVGALIMVLGAAAIIVFGSAG